MFNKFLNWIRGVMKKMLDRGTIKKQFNVDINISDKMVNSIELWSKMFENKSPWLDKNTQSLNLAATISNEVARLVTLELESEISGSKRADYLNEIYQDFLGSIRHYVEYGCGKGGTIFKPYINNGDMTIEVIQANKFYPTEYDNRGKMTGAIFVSQKIDGKVFYTRLEYHRFISGVYVIDNIAFKSNSKEMLGDQVSLTEIPEWASIEPRTAIQDLEQPLFSYFKVPFANQIDPESPLGVSVFSRAVDLIKEADKQYSRILWEYEGSELAIDADASVLQNDEINKRLKLPHLKDRLFRSIGNTKDGDFYEVFSPSIRDVSLFNGLDKLLKKIEFACGLAYGTISDPQTVDKTATEVKQARQRSYANVADIQTALQKALDDLIYAVDALVSLYALAPAGDYEVSYKWDDSIIVDAEVERKQDIQDIGLGVMSKEEYRAKWYGETIEQARGNLPQQADVIE